MAEIPEIDKLLEGMTPLGFAAKPEDHVALYALLACPVSARYVTGTTISSDGGIGVG
jgi:cis-1,2-dihydro-1,2-dihydroxynaphthalene/dibenzothiophene dihydrodiol dehydrogenase